MKLKDFINSEIMVMVSTKVDRVFEYTGVLSEEEDDTIVLKDVRISLVIDEWSKKHSPIKENWVYYPGEHIETAIINKKYIISYVKK